MGSHCNLICCPNCGYQVVDTTRTRIGGWLTRRSGSSRRAAEAPVEPAARAPRETIPLSHVLPGREVEIVALRDMTGPSISRLGAFGVVPGSRVEVVQRRPAPVVRMGETEIALGLDILEHIEVAVPDATPDRD
jgi:Fe2+ transport system protein FeoA